MKYHICIGCLVEIPVKKEWLDHPHHVQTICDYCFFDVGEIITKFKGTKRWKLLRQYQVKHMMLRVNIAGKFLQSPYPWRNKR